MEEKIFFDEVWDSTPIPAGVQTSNVPPVYSDDFTWFFDEAVWEGVLDEEWSGAIRASAALGSPDLAVQEHPWLADDDIDDDFFEHFSNDDVEMAVGDDWPWDQVDEALDDFAAWALTELFGANAPAPLPYVSEDAWPHDDITDDSTDWFAGNDDAVGAAAPPLLPYVIEDAWPHDDTTDDVTDWFAGNDDKVGQNGIVLISNDRFYSVALQIVPPPRFVIESALSTGFPVELRVSLVDGDTNITTEKLLKVIAGLEAILNYLKIQGIRV